MPPLPLAAALHAEFPAASDRARAVLTALAASNGNIGSADHLAAMAALRNRFQLARLLRREGLPPVERLAAWTRVLHWTSLAETTGSSLSTLALRSGVAPATAYRLVKRAAGSRWAVVRRNGLSDLLQRFSRACRSHAAESVMPKVWSFTEAPTAVPPDAIAVHQSRRCTACRSRSPVPLPSRMVEATVLISGQPFDVAWYSQDRAYVTCGHRGVVREVDLAAHRVSDTIQVGSVPTRIVVSPRTAHAYVSNQFSRTISVIDITSRSLVDEIRVSGDPVPLVLEPSGDVLHVATNEDCIFAIDLVAGRVKDALALPATSHHMAMHPQQRRLYVSTRAAGAILELELTPYVVSRRWVVGGIPQSLVIAKDGRRIFVANEVGRIDILDLVRGRVIGCIELGQGGGFGIALSPNERELFVSLPSSGQIKIFDARTLRRIGTVSVGGTPRELAVDPMKPRLLVANEAGWLTIFRKMPARDLLVPRRPSAN